MSLLGEAGMIEYASHSVDERDIDAVVRVLRSKRLTQGPEISQFEDEFARTVGSAYAVCFSSGTAALHAALFTAGVGPGDKVLTSALGFVASANAPKYLGAEVEFADIDDDLNMVSREGDWAATIPVHFAGLPCDVSQFKGVVIEDACHALGVPGIGSCEHSDFCCFSLHPSKAITSAEGGVVCCRTKANVKVLKRFRNHGFELSEGWYRDQTSLGMNYRMSDLHAALGRSQLKRLDDFITRRHEVAGRYLEELSGVVALPPYSPHHAWHLFVIRTPARNAVYKALKERGIQTQVHYMPLYRNNFHRGPDWKDFPNTEAYYSECLSLPIYPSLKDEEQTQVIEAIRDVV